MIIKVFGEAFFKKLQGNVTFLKKGDTQKLLSLSQPGCFQALSLAPHPPEGDAAQERSAQSGRLARTPRLRMA
ncbi:hypothetical protein NJLHNGOC_05655 [Novacetimonas cocois]|uniref:Uncharacterized protein n=1 Tax=Novacetimonas cocois TaxID=1747507 RepID=A0A365YXD5_9PROT|nr:hypothetical protein NJLHNGOC_05655 [Novacetimonas cocois]